MITVTVDDVRCVDADADVQDTDDEEDEKSDQDLVVDDENQVDVSYLMLPGRCSH